MCQQLQDIFTVYPHTPCHTHDLLECPCESSGATKQDADAAANDDDDDDASDGEEEQRMVFMSASQVRPEHIEKLDKAVCPYLDAALRRLLNDCVVFEAEEGAIGCSGQMDPHQLSQAECALSRPRRCPFADAVREAIFEACPCHQSISTGESPRCH